MPPRNATTLRRWQLLSERVAGLPARLPDSLEELNETQKLILQDADAEFHQILGNTAPAELELAVAQNKWSDTPPDPQVEAQRAREQQISELTELAKNGNQTALFMLRGLDEAKAAQVELATAPDPAALRAAAEDAAERDAAARRQSFEFAIGARRAATGGGI